MKRLFGGLLMAVGILVAALSGLCSLFMLGQSGGGGIVMFPIVLVVGGLPVLLGVGMIFGGRALLRSTSRPDLGTFGESSPVHEGPVRPAHRIDPEEGTPHE